MKDSWRDKEKRFGTKPSTADLQAEEDGCPFADSEADFIYIDD